MNINNSRRRRDVNIENIVSVSFFSRGAVKAARFGSKQRATSRGPHVSTQLRTHESVGEPETQGGSAPHHSPNSDHRIADGGLLLLGLIVRAHKYFGELKCGAETVDVC